MNKHLSTLSVLHYVYGGFQCFTGLFLLLFIFVGHFLNSDWLMAHSHGEPPPPFVGWLVTAFGWFLFILAEAWGILNIVSGHKIAQRRGRMFSMVMAGANCLSFPFGTALGIFTFVVLNDSEVRAAYGEA